ncbi:hypothetical protein NC652_011351 [Populus alba x Populus x berolinensis]|nr:hypothetical protein NC652_011351 [Populus alba x Populus x berolinensis]
MLYKLKNLSLPTNLLEGSIPTTITNCTQLLNIDLSFNRITGKLPQGLGQLYNLINLFLEPNQMSGEIPADIYSFSDKQQLEPSDLEPRRLHIVPKKNRRFIEL